MLMIIFPPMKFTKLTFFTCFIRFEFQPVFFHDICYCLFVYVLQRGAKAQLSRGEREITQPLFVKSSCIRFCNFWQISLKKYSNHYIVKQSGAVEACLAHNQEVRRSKLRSAKAFINISISGPATMCVVYIRHGVL